MGSKKEIATFACGCFWGVEYLFSKIPGVISVQSGYIGGNENRYPSPTYEQVCSGKTGYAESVRITFNPEKINYKTLLKVFWSIHDPTTLNRQGPDLGTQYRSAVFYQNEQQKKEAEISKIALQKITSKKIVTEIKKAGNFFTAEEYHQKYVEKHGIFSCHIPKIPSNILK